MPVKKQQQKTDYIYIYTLLLLRFSLYKTKPEKRGCQFTSPPFFFFAPSSIFIPSDLHVPLCFCSFLLHHIFLPAFHVTRERIQIGAAMSQSQRKTERTGVSRTSETLRRIRRTEREVWDGTDTVASVHVNMNVSSSEWAI